MISKSDKNTFLELALISAICFVLGFIVFYDNSDTQTQNEPIVEQFDDYPLYAWQTTDKDGGECVKIKYRVLREKTRLYMSNSNGEIGLKLMFGNYTEQNGQIRFHQVSI